MSYAVFKVSDFKSVLWFEEKSSEKYPSVIKETVVYQCLKVINQFGHIGENKNENTIWVDGITSTLRRKYRNTELQQKQTNKQMPTYCFKTDCSIKLPYCLLCLGI